MQGTPYSLYCKDINNPLLNCAFFTKKGEMTALLLTAHFIGFIIFFEYNI